MKDKVSVSGGTAEYVSANGFDYSAAGDEPGDTSSMDFYRATLVAIEDQTVVEFSMYADENVKNGLGISAGAVYTYEYTDSEGKTVLANDGIHDWITMEKGYIYAGSSIAGNEICKAENGHWYRIACVMNPSAYTMDIYVNGELTKSNVSLDKIEYVVADGLFVEYIRQHECTDRFNSMVII